MKAPETLAPEPKVAPAASAPARLSEREIVSTFGAGLLITGNVVSTGAIQVFGRITGDIHAAHVTVGKGATVDGNIRAQDAVIDGNFKGTIHGNTVKLQSTAAVEGEIYNRSLSIDQNAHFEGVARRLTATVEAPSQDQVSGKPQQPVVAAVETVHRDDTRHADGYANGHTSGFAQQNDGFTVANASASASASAY